jgi:TolB-like protein/DNA-binding winged helix-turn-helix (wHTH) protein
METLNPIGQVFTFGPFEVNLRTGELRKRGVRVWLQEQPLRILVALLERPGEIVSREDLCRRLWPQGTFVDFEHSLNAAVRRLRVTLGDEAEVPRFVQTVHRRGYRFLSWGESGMRQGDLRTGLAPVERASAATRLAVLPFVSFDCEPLAGCFTEGLTEEIITQMARLCPAHVGVIARTSVMRLVGSAQYSAASAGAAETGRALGADYLLEGSIRREGHRVRIIAQLIESHEETHVWAATYDRVISEAMTVQTEVADEIARSVASVLSALQPGLSREAAS